MSSGINRRAFIGGAAATATAAAAGAPAVRRGGVKPTVIASGNGFESRNDDFYVLGRNGEHAGVAFYGGRSYAVCDESGPRHEPIEGLLG